MSQETTYKCWGEDGEDLTAKVEEALKQRGHVTIQEDAAPGATDTNAVVVFCSTKNHENVFYIAEG
jgi:hypothetical protein